MAIYAEGYAGRSHSRSTSAALAFGLTILPVAGLIVSLGVRQVVETTTTLIAEPIAAPKPPPPPDPKPQPEAKAAPDEKVFTPLPPRPLPQTPDRVETTADPSPPQPQPIPPGTGEIGTVKATPTPALPLLIGAAIDPRYANAFQPPYPPEESRAGREGRVVVRVLIGTDGRVKQVERVSATSDAFFAAVERQALSRWRFTPATRDGVPVEQWKQMGLRFELNGGD